jgi:hypothetical protein
LSIALMLSSTLPLVPVPPRLTKKTSFPHYFCRISKRFLYALCVFAYTRVHCTYTRVCARIRAYTPRVQSYAYIRVWRIAYYGTRVFACRFLRDERIWSAYIRIPHARIPYTRLYAPRHAYTRIFSRDPIRTRAYTLPMSGLSPI